LGIVADQFGQPTNANDLAEAIMEIIETKNKTFGVFHFSNYPKQHGLNLLKKLLNFQNLQLN
jgi:dTDP-4-dehydrorhamnose reductase